MNLLVLGCPTGGGHDAAGRAVRAQAAALGHNAVFLDYTELIGARAAALVEKAYVKTVALAPPLFGAVYRLGAAVSHLLGKTPSPVYRASARAAQALENVITNGNFDAVVCTHLYPAEAMTALRRAGRAAPFIAVATDYAVIPFWQEIEPDVFTLAHEDNLPQFAAAGIDPARCLATGIPVGAAARDAATLPKARAKALLALPPGRAAVLAGGSMGAGPIVKIAEHIAAALRADDSLSVICGSNKALREKLSRRFAGRADVRILGTTAAMALYTRAADVLCTKPGGLTSTEAAVIGTPIVHMPPIPGIESLNRAFFTSHGLSLPYEDAGDIFPGAPTASAIQTAMRRHIRPDAAEQIVRAAQALV